MHKEGLLKDSWKLRYSEYYLCRRHFVHHKCPHGPAWNQIQSSTVRD